MSFAVTMAAAAPALKTVMGEAATYTAPGGVAQAITGIFDAAHVFTEFDGEAQVSTTAPVLDVLISDLLAAPVKGAEVTVAGTDYEVLDVMPDGRQGWSKLRLVEA